MSACVTGRKRQREKETVRESRHRVENESQRKRGFENKKKQTM